jgi:Uncharacterized conserved protein (some members contain a von Willebrand factor type A (vWA) domain)
MIAPRLHPESMQASCQARGKLAFSFTPRAVVLLAAGLILALPGFFSPRLGYGMIAWDAILLIAAAWDGLRLPRPEAIAIERSWSNAPALNSETEIGLSIRQSGNASLDCILIDNLPEALVLTPERHRLRSYPGSGGTVRYRMEPRERGDVRTGSVFVRYRSALGLMERWAFAPLEQDIRIYPALRQSENQKIFLARARQVEMQIRQAQQRGIGREFESLREFVQGDDLRDVCWTATARRGQLVTRRYQTERSQPVWIVLDAGRLMRGRIEADTSSSRAMAHSKLDFACSTAVVLAQLALYSGDRVGLLVYGKSLQQRVLPGRGAAHLRVLLECLAQAKAEPYEADHMRASAALSRLQPRRAMVLWVTDLAETAMRPEVVDGALALLHRHLLLFVAMAQPDVAAIAKATPQTVPQMFRAAAAQELAGRRERLLAQLREQGALTLDLDPRIVTAAVLNEYLRIKEQAKL